ncbi:MAG: hypothetical protein WBW48_08510 [Anaerolineae bacterium]
MTILDDSTAQGRRALYGRDFEAIVGMILNELLNPQGIFIIKGTATHRSLIFRPKSEFNHNI